MTDVRDAAISFEAVKTSISQNKDGIILRLAVHPQECPPELLCSHVGTRYYVALVEIGDDEQPKVDDAALDRERCIKSAGMLCRDAMFHRFLKGMGYLIGDDPEKSAANAMRVILGIQSRADLKTDAKALADFKKLRHDFIEWRKKNET